MKRRAVTLPLMHLLARLGWQRDSDAWTIRCRDSQGKQAYLRVQLAVHGIALVPSSPGPWNLGPWQTGRLRRALADALVSYDQLGGSEPPDLAPRRHGATPRAEASAPTAATPREHRPPSSPIPRQRVRLDQVRRPSTADIASRVTAEMTRDLEDQHAQDNGHVHHQATAGVAA
jgi:hypothetical protein